MVGPGFPAWAENQFYGLWHGSGLGIGCSREQPEPENTSDGLNIKRHGTARHRRRRSLVWTTATHTRLIYDVCVRACA